MTRRTPRKRAEVLARYQGPAHAAPYPLSRMAPSFDLVDAAKEIQRADEMLANVTGGKLGVIAEQMRSLRREAEKILARAKRDAELHRAKCNFEKTPGQILHLYRRDSGELYFSLLGPHEWTLEHAQTFVGSYRLELDLSFTLLEEVDAPDP